MPRVFSFADDEASHNLRGHDRTLFQKTDKGFTHNIIVYSRGEREVKIIKRFSVNGRKVLPVSVSLALFLALICFGRVTVMSSITIRVPEDFATIQGAINNATDGDTIRVNNGVYHERLNVNKSVTVYGMNPDTTIIEGNGLGNVVSITAPGVDLHGFTITNGSTGLYVYNTSSDNVIYWNKILSNTNEGIYIYFSTGNTFSHNDMTANGEDFRVRGGALRDFLQTVDEYNTVDGKTMYYWVNETDRTIPLNAGYVALVNCKNITVENLHIGFWAAWSTNITARNLDLNGDRILFRYTNDSRIENVMMRYGSTDIELQDSAHNAVYNNTLLSCSLGINLGSANFNVFCDNTFRNTLCGIGLMNSTGNIFYHNNFIDITNGDVVPTSDSVGNHWDNGAEGNYWSDKPGNDANGDGINDAPTRAGPYENDTFPLNEVWSPLREINATLWYSPNAPTQYFAILESSHVIASRKFVPRWVEGYGLITFNVTASAAGFCNVTVPRVRLDIPIEVKINGTIVNEDDYDLTYVNTTWSLCFNYTQGKCMIEIKGYKLGFAIGDLDGDGVVNMGDINKALENFGRHYP